MEEKWIVYLHINKSNKKTYVGITHYHDNPNKRWVSGNGYRKDSLISKAINKYGWDNFKHIVLCKTSKRHACILEVALIALYKRKGLSYNIGLGGEGSESFSEETKNKLRQYTPWIKGKHHSEGARLKIGQASRSRKLSDATKSKIGIANKGKNNGMYGKTLSIAVRHAISKRFSKPVLQFDLNGVFIKEYESASKAEKELNKKGGHISCCCLGKRDTAYGYKWKYKNE